MLGLPQSLPAANTFLADHGGTGPEEASVIDQSNKPLLRRTLAPQCRLVIMRHGKSSWREPSLADHARPLNKRGRRDVLRVAAELQRRGWAPKAVIMSDSARTIETWERMKVGFDRPPTGEAVQSDAQLYNTHAHSGPGTVQQALLRADGSTGGSVATSSATASLRTASLRAASRQRDPLADLLNLSDSPSALSGGSNAVQLPRPGPVMVLGHNPGLEQVVAQLTGRGDQDQIELKTATAVLLEISADSWREALDPEAKWTIRGVINPKELCDDVAVRPPLQLFSPSDVMKIAAPQLSSEEHWT